MTTALRIASVTYVLKDLLNNGLIDHNVSGGIGVNVIVTALSPDKIDTSVNNEQSQLNLFMYQATYNQGWKNVGLPSFSSNGNRVNNQPLAIDLHYLLTAYGSQELHTDILLGYGMQLLHQTPVLDRKAINTSIGSPVGGNFTALPSSLRKLSDSGLADQVEMITITPEILSIEDISKLWAAFATKYRPTAAYKVTVVLIESDKSTKKGPPVKTRNIYVQPLKKPVIEEVLSQSAEGQPIIGDQKILNGYFLVLSGANFYNENTQVVIDGSHAVPKTSKLIITDTRISFQLTDDLNLEAGNHNIKIVQPIAMGNDSPPQPKHSGVESEPSTFVLSPRLVKATPATVTIPDNGSSNITVTINPKAKPGQKVALLLNALTADVNGNFPAYTFATSLPGLITDPGAVPTDTVSITIQNVVKAQYAVRVRVDGIESPVNYPLGSDASQVITIQ
ncbi:MAG: DUF4255 domain-containing protein [Flavisolibacter sp.]